MRHIAVLTALLALAVAPACRNSEAPAGSQSLLDGKPAAAAPTGATAAAAGGAAAGSAAAPVNVTGKVLERIDASSYSYLKIQTEAGEVWAAVPQTPVEVGTEVGIAQAMRMTNFSSPTLNRTFEEIWFGVLAGQDAGKVAAAAARKEQAHGGMGATHAAAAAGPADAEAPVEKIAKAEGGKTVAEVYTNAATLAGKPVLVRGKVVKVNSGIMDRNWIHVRDGTADAAGSNDLTFTTATDVPKVGEVITIGGTVAVDRDFGAGYKYPVIVEDASVRN